MATKVDRAKTQLIINHPFFASVLLRRPLVETRDIPTAAINRTGRIMYNPDFIEDLSVQQVVFLLAHECMHWIMSTFTRQGTRSMKGWNIATDAVNNEILVQSGVGEFIQGGVRWPGAEDMTAESVYELLPKDESGEPGGNMAEPGGTGSDLDDSGDPMTPAEARELETQVKIEMSQAMQAAKQQGKMPSAVQRLVEEILHPRTPWHTILERWMTERAANDYSWHRPNRRYVGMDLYLPSIDGTGMGEVAIITDTSASISFRELAEFNGHINVLLEQVKPERVHVVYVDADVSRVDEFTPDQLPLRIDPEGGGGTDMRVGCDYVERHLPDVACCVMLTDGYTPWPKHMSVPMIVATTGAECPIAETVHLEVDDG